MEKLFLKGCGTALLTPFRNGEVDYDAYVAMIDRQVKAGVDFLVPLATTGETPALTPEEKLELMKITREHAKGLPLLTGCGSNSVQGTLQNMKLLENSGADAWLVVVPFYNKPTQEGQYRYFRTIAESTDKPIVIYNVPGRTGANMTAATFARLTRDVPSIIAIKEASGNYSQVSEMVSLAPEGVSVLSGDDDMTLAFMATGAKGVISVVSNIVPEKVAAMTRAALADDIVTARKIHHELFPLAKACFVESNPIPAKAALALLGLCTDEVRLPLAPASETTVALMKKLLGR